MSGHDLQLVPGFNKATSSVPSLNSNCLMATKDHAFSMDFWNTEEYLRIKVRPIDYELRVVQRKSVKECVRTL